MLLVGREKSFKNDFEAEDIYNIWENYCKKNCPNLLEKVPIKEIYFERLGGGFGGLDYVKKDNFEEHLLMMEKTPDDFLHGLNNNRIGICETIELLKQAGSDKRTLAAIWMIAFYLTIKEELPRKWCGKIYNAFERIELMLVKEDYNVDLCWSAGTKKLIPEILYSDYIYENIEINTLEDLIEMIALNCAYFLEEYYIVNYYSKK